MVVVDIELDDIAPAADEAAAAEESTIGAPLSTAVVVVVEVSEEVTVVSVFFWQAPRPQGDGESGAIDHWGSLLDWGRPITGHAAVRFPSRTEIRLHRPP